MSELEKRVEHLEAELSDLKKEQYNLYREVKTFDKRVEEKSQEFQDKNTMALNEYSRMHKDFELRSKGLVESYNANDDRNLDKLKKMESKFMGQLEELKNMMVLSAEKLEGLEKKVSSENDKKVIGELKNKMAAMMALVGG